MNRTDEDRRTAVRVKYDMSYWAADCDGENIPSRPEFRQVKGCDLSPVGISFYMDVAPKSDHVALMFVGQKFKSYMLSRVIHHTSCLVEGKRRYLVGCQFERALVPKDDE